MHSICDKITPVTTVPPVAVAMLEHRFWVT